MPMTQTSQSTRPGEVLFARYAYPPNELGYCGPDDSAGLLDVAAQLRSPSKEDFRSRARAFDGAWVYLELIAAHAGIEDPLDPRVVEAYWIGNSLLDEVDPVSFAATARSRFAGEAGAHWAALTSSGSPASTPHHGFQVFTVYPWVLLLGRGDTPLMVLDRCRIRWAQVAAVHGDRLEVMCAPLSWDGHQLGWGPDHQETVRWALDGRSPLARPDIGDWISLHWDWACDRLAPAQLDELRSRTQDQLVITNRALDRQGHCDGGAVGSH
jgi:hypothetical protein